MMWGYDGGWVGWLLMTLMMVLFWGSLIALAVWLVRQPDRRGDARMSSRAILEERFARGEIDEAEFTERLEVLSRAAGRKRQ